MEFEPEILSKLGFEVYAPKFSKSIPKYHTLGGMRGFSNLNIPKEDLKIFHTINKHFDYIITINGFEFNVAFFKYFKDKIFLRSFGLVGKANYEDVICSSQKYENSPLVF